MTIGVILLFIGSGNIPITAQAIGKPSLPTSGGNWFYVGGSGPGNYTNIQDAIDNASDGNTVFVFNGTYYGYVIINKSLNLIGEDKNTTIINGYFAYTISIITDQVNMSGLTIKNGGRLGEGVRIDSNYNNIFNNIIDIPKDRIRLFGHSNTFSGNTIKNTYLYISGDNNIVSGNNITNDYYGIFLTDCWDNIISNNSMFNSGLFISVENICNNIVTNNTVNGKPLVYVYNESDLVLDGDAGQIILINCTNITVQNQEIFNTTVGIQILESNTCLLLDNTLTGNHYGIVLYGWNNTIHDNTITRNFDAIRLSGGSNIITGNTITNNDDGIYLGHSTDYNNIISNTIANNYYGIQLDSGCDFNIILNNTITHNNDAIRISGDSNTISGNTISNNNGSVIYISNNEGNNIVDNIITNNNGDGVRLFGDKNIVTANTISNNKENGIFLDDCDFNYIIENIITHNIYDGIRLFGDNNTISANTITNNNNGIYVLRNHYSNIKGNNITWNNWSGIYLNCSNSNTISGNSISKNRQGIYFVSSTNNTVLKNNFLRNKRHALFENCTNIWNENYWGRPRILPKLIFGIRIIQNKWPLPLFDIDWYPAQESYDIPGMS